MQSEGNAVRLKVKEAVIVEGKYDKIKLSSLIKSEASGLRKTR